VGRESARLWPGDSPPNGAAVALVDVNEQAAEEAVAAIRETGGRAVAIPADVTDRGQVQAAVDRTVAEFGGLHILVNNAGVTRDNLLFKMTDADWATVMAVHLQGAFLMTQLAQVHMVQARYGRVISMSSASALGNRGQANYSAAKAGIQGFTRTLAVELGPFGITANSIAPGFIETAMTQATATRLGITIDEMRESVAAAAPVRRAGVPADIANAVAFFAAEEAGYVSGQILYVDAAAAAVR
jgi:3-oxoacyl-[acyl-carrier protein] reductase